MGREGTGFEPHLQVWTLHPTMQPMPPATPRDDSELSVLRLWVFSLSFRLIFFMGFSWLNEGLNDPNIVSKFSAVSKSLKTLKWPCLDWNRIFAT